jgi:hypothetical protein
MGAPGFGGKRRSPEEIKREGWREQKVLVVSETIRADLARA